MSSSLIVSQEPVWRDQFYSGNVKTERGGLHHGQMIHEKAAFHVGDSNVLGT